MVIGSEDPDFAGGAYVKQNVPDAFGQPVNLMLGALVVVVILFMTFQKNPMIRISAIMIGLIVGFIVAAMLGKVNFASLGSGPIFALPIPFKYGFSFDLGLFLPVAFIYLITAIETTGDLTANSVISGEPVSGETYLKRIKGGVNTLMNTGISG